MDYHKLLKLKKLKKTKKTKKTGGHYHNVFTVKTHNIGPRNHFFNYYNNIGITYLNPQTYQYQNSRADEQISFDTFLQRGQVQPKTYLSGIVWDRNNPNLIYKSYRNRCQAKLGLPRNLNEYMARTQIADVCLLQEVQPIIINNIEQTSGRLGITNTPWDHDYIYNRTGNNHYVPWNDENAVPQEYNHGCAIAWKRGKFNDIHLLPVTQDTLLSGRSSGWVILTKNNQRYGFLSVHVPIRNNLSTTVLNELDTEIGILARRYDNIIPIIGGDFNKDIRPQNWNNGVQFLNYPNAINNTYLDGQGTNDNWSFSDDIVAVIRENYNNDRSVYGVSPTHYDYQNQNQNVPSDVDFFLSNNQLNYNGLNKTPNVVYQGDIRSYNWQDDLRRDFDHYPLTMNVTIPEPRKKKEEDLLITVADSPKASKKLNAKANAFNPNPNPNAYTYQMV